MKALARKIDTRFVIRDIKLIGKRFQFEIFVISPSAQVTKITFLAKIRGMGNTRV